MHYLDSLNTRQKEAVMHTSGPLLVVAGAGAGKTRVIVHRILHLIHEGIAPENILAITFTNKAAKEMRERVGALMQGRERPFVATFHALGVHILRAHARAAGLPRRFAIFDRGDSIRAVKNAMKARDIDPKAFEPKKFLSAISKQKGDGIMLDAYEARAGNEFFPRMVADVWRGYEHELRVGKALDFDDLLVRTLDLLERHENIRAHYQGVWSHIHIDEYQDTNAVQYKLANTLAAAHNNICVVGDMDQCVAAGTLVTMANGTRRPIEKMKTGDVVLSNYGSGDCRGARVVQTHSGTYAGDLVKISTKNGNTLMSTPEHIHFAGYQLNKTPQKYFVYLMYKKHIGFRLGISQMYTNGQKRAVPGFQLRCNQEHADAVWIISAHDSPQESRILEYTLSLQYKIPTLPFVARKGMSNNGYVHDQNVLDSIFASFNTRQSALKLLRDYRLCMEHPHHRPQSHGNDRRNIVITLCGDRRGKTPMHRISIVGNDRKEKRSLVNAGFSVRSVKQGSQSWRFETCHKKYAEILKRVRQIQNVLPHAVVVRTARLGNNRSGMKAKNSLAFLPAASVRPGMVLFNEKGNYDLVTNVEYQTTEKQTVYDLDIEHTHNFIANNMVTHNSIYSWRGARAKNIFDFEKHYPDAATILLEQNYRSTKTIIGASNDVIRKNTERKEKNVFTDNQVGENITLMPTLDETHEAATVAENAAALIESGAEPREIAVLYRANFQSRALEEAFLARDVPYQVLGTRFFERKEVKDMLSFVAAAENPESAAALARIVNVPPRGIGKTTLMRMVEKKEYELTPAMKRRVDDFRAFLMEVRRRTECEPPSSVLQYIFHTSGLHNTLKHGSEDDVERLENIKELIALAKRYDTLPPEAGMEKLLEDSALVSDQDELRENTNAVRLMTVHASKGLEFDRVFITGLEDGLFPHASDNPEKDNEEERRLFYVALTRARKKVYLTYANTRTIFGSKGVQLPSEFIADIPDHFLEYEEPAASPTRTIYFD